MNASSGNRAIRSARYRGGMASKQPEIIRTLDDGFIVAWDTTEVSDAVRRGFEGVISKQADLLVKILLDDGSEAVHVVEVKSGGATAETQEGASGWQKEPKKAASSRRGRNRRAASA
jgi:hypothetical protein